MSVYLFSWLPNVDIQLFRPKLGIKAFQWSPTSQFLALGSYDSYVRIICHGAWFSIKEFNHPDSVDWRHCAVYREYYTKPGDIGIETTVNRTLKPKQLDQYGLPIVKDDDELKEWIEKTLTSQTKYEYIESSKTDTIRVPEEVKPIIFFVLTFNYSICYRSSSLIG